MATRTTSPAPSPENGREKSKPWVPPTSDQEFVYEGPDSVPDWVDKGWASFDRGPALAVPAGDLYGEGPYHTRTARVGDKVVFTAAKGATPAKLDVIASEPDPREGGATKRPPQQTAAQEEDMLKNGMLTPEDMADDAKAQVVARSPRLKRMVEEGEGLPEAQAVSDVVKTE
jgi:hypothetical protein